MTCLNTARALYAAFDVILSIDRKPTTWSRSLGREKRNTSLGQDYALPSSSSLQIRVETTVEETHKLRPCNLVESSPAGQT